ncbi:MAG: 1-deoxy-D-xylulose 5-phosphate reductoisomerase [candidate division TA06 bacterium 32_111]|uniref:1-deoxy-D-xylulose 5-phosphate reductoisomerase n=2 Tax=Bacteria candidate phyla TaxID=1783234 RepID=A0A101I2Z1_UNCT6|nr:MAG: 1-deoxy-D-xylulose 5-phosphate reductoisomerase [candidate division TA06 bacterium 32_111]KUK87283.1 MAG: 1-deoxy-D-xylulose 5-phosphate reductoisomerase [candidate division TA06 bacterium 34_109]HAF07583.1 1-deoxy-D-xylulose-5-phosphate reductoisomerase [candidate division WOR-3 bacterium]HCP16134.1 1-deoxy-D-xylulose-5-phosphate reductoisomerase [candidate division WOR-3 bacterium]
MKRIVILGATGSIGKSTLKVVKKYPQKFKIVGITAKRNKEQLLKIAENFSVKNVGIYNESVVFEGNKKKNIDGDVNSYFVNKLDYDIIVNALVGSIGFYPTYYGIKRGKIIALANKETIVSYGDIIKKELRKNKRAVIKPVDSEHSALWQLLSFIDRKKVEKCYITASGGVPFKTKRYDLTLDEVLKHPVWNMGIKVTVDSSTMVNKGLEIIEACRLFSLSPDMVGVMIHPNSLVHAIVLLKDGTYISHMAYPDMILPIEYALLHPDRGKTPSVKLLDENVTLNLSFHPAPFEKYKSLKLAYRAVKMGGNMPAVFNAANEKAVELFIRGEIKFNQIVGLIEKVMKKIKFVKRVTIENIRESEKEAKRLTENFGEKL